MKLSTPEIVWHNKEPVFTVDFHRNGPNWRLVTGGADNDVKVSWLHMVAKLVYCLFVECMYCTYVQYVRCY